MSYSVELWKLGWGQQNCTQYLFWWDNWLIHCTTCVKKRLMYFGTTLNGCIVGFPKTKHKNLKYVILCWILKIHKHSIIKLYKQKDKSLFWKTDYSLYQLSKKKQIMRLELLVTDVYSLFQNQKVKNSNMSYYVEFWRYTSLVSSNYTQYRFFGTNDYFIVSLVWEK